MPRQTQTYPRTLIDLLQLKDARPFGVEDSYQGVIDLIDILGMDRLTTQNVSTATVVDGSTGSVQILTVPEGELWVMVAASARILANDPGDVLQLALRHTRRGRGASYVANSPKVTATLANERVRVALVYPRPTILVPGDLLQVEGMYSAAVAGPTTMTLYAEYYRFGPDSLGDAL